MPSPNATPTPITPPRVPLIDPRTGLIDRAWYMFFLSLNNVATAVVDDVNLGSDVESLVASYDAALRSVNQELQTLPPVVTLPVPDVLGDCCSALESEVAEMQKQIQGLQLTPPPREFKLARYGSFYDTTTQVAATINTATAATFNNTKLSNGVVIGSPTSRIVVDSEGIYNFTASFQLDNIGSSTADIFFWFRLNGVNVPDSGRQIEVSAGGGSLVANATGTGSQTIFVLAFAPNQIFINGVYQDKNTYTLVGTTVTFSTAPPLTSIIEFSFLNESDSAAVVPSLNYFFDLKANDYVELMFSVTDVNVELKTFPAVAPYPRIPSIILTVANNIGGFQ
jgi:hypothetical protein